MADGEQAEDDLPGRAQAAADFLEGPSLRDALSAGIELTGNGDWLAPRVEATAHGLDRSGWMLRRLGLANP